MSVRDDLIAVRELLRLHWTRGTFARTLDGTPCNPHNEDARTFCLVGAVMHVTNTNVGTLDETYTVIAQHCFPENVSNYNDTNGKEKVIGMLGELIEANP